MRYERKFRIEHMSAAALQQLLQLHPAAFYELYPDRQINNIYLDTPQLTTWNDNIYGVNQRKKYRIRWYGQDLREIRSAKLEQKIKHNELGTKKSYAISGFRMEDIEQVCQELPQIDPSFPLLVPSLINTYQRSYLMSFDGRFRLTIDRDMCFYPYSGTLSSGSGELNEPMRDAALILEIKYEAADDSLVEQITQHLPFRQSRHSKYVTGILLTR
ncbi:MAG: polyphosphate polymerase domain-containing protein [Bacteroidota bacterium]